MGALSKRHPDALPATILSPSFALLWLLALGGNRRAALGVAIVKTVLVSRKLQGLSDRPNRLAGVLVARGVLATGLGLAQAIRRAWAPPLFIAAVRQSSSRRLLLAAFAAPVVQDALATREPGSVLGDAAIRLLDEAVALAGTWEGCLKQRTLRPLLPAASRARSPVRSTSMETR